MASRQALGRGLSALIPDAKGPARTGIANIPIGEIHPSPNQPRKNVQSRQLKELIASVQEQGILEPIIVRTREQGGYEIVVGERRYRAAKALGFQTIPSIIREVTKIEALEIALVENLQREDLTPLEESQTYHQLITELHVTQEELAKKVGKDRATISNTLRLLKLPPDIQQHLNTGALSLAHALILLSIEDAPTLRRLATKIVHEGLSVKAAEGLAKALRPEPHRRRRSILKPTANVHLRKAETDLSRLLGTKVHIQGTSKRGRITIEYYSLNDLERIIDRLK